MTTLYEQLGGSAGIAALVDDIVAAHLANPTIQARYQPLIDDPERMAQAKQHLRDFLASGSGGPETYEGRSMPDTHRGMNIGAGEYMAAMEDIIGTLEAHDVPENAQKDVLMIAWSLRGEIMRI